MKLEQLIPLLIKEAMKAENVSHAKNKGHMEFQRKSHDLGGPVLGSPGYFGHITYLNREGEEFLGVSSISPNSYTPVLSARTPVTAENQFVVEVQGKKYAIVQYNEVPLDDLVRKWNIGGVQPKPKKIPIYRMGLKLLGLNPERN